MIKKVTFGGKRPTNSNLDPDGWVQNREVEVVKPKEAMKRFTIDVPVSLHKRIKSTCALQNLVMADVIRDMLEEKFPESVGQGVPT